MSFIRIFNYIFFITNKIFSVCYFQLQIICNKTHITMTFSFDVNTFLWRGGHLLSLAVSHQVQGSGHPYCSSKNDDDNGYQRDGYYKRTPRTCTPSLTAQFNKKRNSPSLPYLYLRLVKSNQFSSVKNLINLVARYKINYRIDKVSLCLDS